jgi:25S rRNA (uracil2634-N3)-methyltransferase
MHFLKKLGPNILILGDGNLSFSLALSIMLPNSHITATVYEDENEWKRKYADLEANVLNKIRNECINNTKVFFKVDALNLKEMCQKLNFTDVIFNFPHHGGKTNLRKSRLLLKQVIFTFYL